VARDGTKLVRITNTPGAEVFPTWSPDRTRIAFTRNFQLFTIHADGTDEQLVAPMAGRERSPGFDYLGPAAWSPDGLRIAYMYPRQPVFDGSDLTDESYGTALHIIDSDGTNDGELPNPPTRTVNSIGWSSTNLLSFTVDDDCADCAGGRFYAFESPDGSDNSAVDQNGTTPNAALDWSPDSSTWVYVGGRDAGNEVDANLIYTSRSDGADISELGASRGTSPRWSPDASAVAFIGDDGNLHVMAGSSDSVIVVGIAQGGTSNGLDW
jgi:Tol biopolymer transport system component